MRVKVYPWSAGAKYEWSDKHRMDCVFNYGNDSPSGRCDPDGNRVETPHVLEWGEVSQWTRRKLGRSSVGNLRTNNEALLGLISAEIRCWRRELGNAVRRKLEKAGLTKCIMMKKKRHII